MADIPSSQLRSMYLQMDKNAELMANNELTLVALQKSMADNQLTSVALQKSLADNQLKLDALEETLDAIQKLVENKFEELTKDKTESDDHRIKIKQTLNDVSRMVSDRLERPQRSECDEYGYGPEY